jgi:4-hydroxybenzoate polyprenyltransferase
MKNLLLFVPLLTSFGFLESDRVLAAGLAFLAFSAVASATYLLNDLADLDSDRSHPRKRYRPLASAQISIPVAGAVAVGLLVLGFVVAAFITPDLVAMLGAYLVVTSGYTWVLKSYVLIDVLTLALLYTLRILAGALAIEVPLSSWLLAFSVFVFLSLALVKRCSELVLLGHQGETASRGRDYRVADLVVLWPLGIGAGLCSVVVFGLFVSTVETQARYGSPQLLWLVGFGLIYWLARLWIKTARGEMHDDPMVFALRDFGSRTTILAMLGVTIAAYFLRMGSP